jgi:hypothetical protein
MSLFCTALRTEQRYRPAGLTALEVPQKQPTDMSAKDGQRHCINRAGQWTLISTYFCWDELFISRTTT